MRVLTVVVAAMRCRHFRHASVVVGHAAVAERLRLERVGAAPRCNSSRFDRVVDVGYPGTESVEKPVEDSTQRNTQRLKYRKAGAHEATYYNGGALRVEGVPDYKVAREVARTQPTTLLVATVMNVTAWGRNRTYTEIKNYVKHYRNLLFHSPCCQLRFLPHNRTREG